MPSTTKTALYAILISLLPLGAVAEQIELSQDQMRQMVAAKHLRSTETIIAEVTSHFDGEIIDIRGFLTDERMTYRLLIQGDGGTIAEVLIDGVTCQLITQSSHIGQTVSGMARTAHIITATQASSSLPVALQLR